MKCTFIKELIKNQEDEMYDLYEDKDKYKENYLRRTKRLYISLKNKHYLETKEVGIQAQIQVEQEPMELETERQGFTISGNSAVLEEKRSPKESRNWRINKLQEM